MPAVDDPPALCQKFGTWFRGRADCHGFMVAGPFDGLVVGDVRGVVTSANGSPAVVAYANRDGTWVAFGIMVIDVAADGVAYSTMYLETSLLRWFGMPESTPASGS
jgi:hypothetical protein